MKYYLISLKDKFYVGYTTSKKMLKEFIRQRGGSEYEINIFSSKDMSKEKRQELEDGNVLGYFYDSWLIFRDEEEYFLESLCTFDQELSMFIRELIDNVEYLRLTKKEKKIVIKGLSEIYKASKLLETGDCDYIEFLDMDNMIKEII